MITLCLDPQPAHSGRMAYTYRVAGHDVALDRSLPELRPFEKAGPHPGLVQASDCLAANSYDARLVYRGPGWLGNRWRGFACWCGRAGYRLAIEGVGLFCVAPEGESVCLERAELGADPAAIVESALGPGLILALALQDTWCLHASAVAFEGQAVAFAGESGNGKSTLAAFLEAEGTPAWQRIADDVLPLEGATAGIEARPHFPQLKLPPEALPVPGLAERLPLHAIYLLDKPTVRQGVPAIRPLSQLDASLGLVRHTIASRLFDKDLLVRHMGFCTQASARVRVRRLTLPRGYGHLPCVRALIKADLKAG